MATESKAENKQTPSQTPEIEQVIDQSQAVHSGKVAQQLKLNPTSLSHDQILYLQRTIGNHQVVKLLSPSTRRSPIQRLTISQADYTALTADIDTTDLVASKAQIDLLSDKNELVTLEALQKLLNLKRKEHSNNAKLATYIGERITSGPNIADKSPMNYFQKKYATWGIGSDDIDPTVKNGLDMWTKGDSDRGISWSVIGQHLRGRLSRPDYIMIGYIALNKNGTWTEDKTEDEQIQAATLSLNDVKGDINGALDALPDFEQTSYRIATCQSPAVYNTTITEGDHIKDTTFWSTSAVRGATGAASGWGVDGTDTVPKVYYIINGSSGKYIAKYSDLPAEQEVMFKDSVIFQVDRIANFRNVSFFVYLTEVDGTALPPNTPIKNPWTGATY